MTDAVSADFSALAVSFYLLVDSIMISRFLKERAMAAYTLSVRLLRKTGSLSCGSGMTAERLIQFIYSEGR